MLFRGTNTVKRNSLNVHVLCNNNHVSHLHAIVRLRRETHHALQTAPFQLGRNEEGVHMSEQQIVTATAQPRNIVVQSCTIHIKRQIDILFQI